MVENEVRRRKRMEKARKDKRDKRNAKQRKHEKMFWFIATQKMNVPSAMH